MPFSIISRRSSSMACLRWCSVRMAMMPVPVPRPPTMATSGIRDLGKDEQLIDAALARLPEWQPPPDFAARVAVLAVERNTLLPLLFRGLRIAAGVSGAAWLGGELVYAGLLSMAAQDGPGVLGWTLTCGALLFACRFALPSRLRA
jgi:hypothetical protein